MNITLTKEKVLKYLGYRNQDISSLINTIENAIKELLLISKIDYIIDYQDIISMDEKAITLDNGLFLQGNSIINRLNGSDQAIIIIATIGNSFDQKMLTLQRIAPLDAMIFDAAGSALVEEVMDGINQKLIADNPEKNLTRRFSPGFGDLPLSTNKSIIDIYNATRRIGVVINKNFLMTPSKTVTAIIGIKRCKNDF